MEHPGSGLGGLYAAVFVAVAFGLYVLISNGGLASTTDRMAFFGGTAAPPVLPVIVRPN